MGEVIDHRYSDGSVEYLLQSEDSKKWIQPDSDKYKELINIYLGKLKEKGRKERRKPQINRCYKPLTKIVREKIINGELYYIVKIEGENTHYLIHSRNVGNMNPQLISTFVEKSFARDPAALGITEYNKIEIHATEYVIDDD
ncbi:hypothetical protein TVAG_245720 [Trichomonas vaginalis G3]|uniref:Uncharacterized protein n=1 Tax=Trichomonas vaginalis (strain ATCC PRA-98 / G3) TaxID=412133 RepID=A2E4N0_TRIV3|nr:hypothetical protein TVAGG3_0862250 [Trichomonas vaginalis G3]EAY12340.1 hypothetical protein TVAG_245720 [Trichomonas vaginalis G3]KAI5500756.1 hypothetical protein TVAGG3_0862250 [Trichomonas vaginalis G3]|eukprot:XP_001324563.1 hypothetical protein [Trichomonas vaginalis G3]